MKTLALLVIVIVAIFFGYPLLNEDARGECDALERVAVRVSLAKDDGKIKPQDQVLGQVAQGLSQGELASAFVKDEYPAMPATAACTMLYWRALFDPKDFREAAKRLHP